VGRGPDTAGDELVIGKEVEDGVDKVLGVEVIVEFSAQFADFFIVSDDFGPHLFAQFVGMKEITKNVQFLTGYVIYVFSLRTGTYTSLVPILHLRWNFDVPFWYPQEQKTSIIWS